ncbi:zinc ribbon domain-containing protein [Ruminococcus sp.]|uniref:zinc ribbon domain-containing protein n=1 Tax=Ruminococcus sp. TaxID=41978 RepID=UPI003863FF27
MSLINCPECGKQISDLAPNCPNCGYPINSSTVPTKQNNNDEIEKYLNLAVNAVKAKNSELVEKYCQLVLEMDPTNSRAWELEARGILFTSSLSNNKVIQAIGAADNAVKYTDNSKSELAESLYDSIYTTIYALLSIAIHRMSTSASPRYVMQCMNYFGALISGISYLSKDKINSELAKFEKMEHDSKCAIMPKKRMIYATRVTTAPWADQYRALLREKGRI